MFQYNGPIAYGDFYKKPVMEKKPQRILSFEEKKINNIRKEISQVLFSDMGKERIYHGHGLNITFDWETAKYHTCDAAGKVYHDTGFSSLGDLLYEYEKYLE